MANSTRLFAYLALAACLCASPLHAGVIKNIFQKLTNTGNKTEDTVRQSVPICGNGLFSTSNENTLSPEFIFITSSASRTLGPRNARSPGRKRDSHNGGGGYSSGRQTSYNDGGGRGGRSESGRVSEVAREFRFNAENVSLSELEEHGFNRGAPVTFLMHGFTSGYPLQAWISAMVEAYTIDRESSGGLSTGAGGYNPGNSGYNGDNYGRESYDNTRRNYNNGHSRRNRRANLQSESRNSSSSSDTSAGRNSSEVVQSRALSSTSSSPRRGGGLVTHNLFIINWNFAARGILYPRAVANIPIVASFATRFINDKLLDEAGVDPKRIQLIGHSLGAHLAGFIGKNTRTRLGRIYGLDPAGPCFGSGLRDLVYPADKRLAPSDADEVIAISTNSALLGIDKPLGRYSVFVEGGANQPGCKPSGILKSLGTLTFDGGDFDTVACSHSRAPNLLTYRFDQNDKEDNCQMVAYACKDWDAFTKGQCGVCTGAQSGGGKLPKRNNPLEPVDCLRIGLDWQYPGSNRRPSSGRPTSSSSSFNNGRDTYDKPSGGYSTRRPNYGESATGGYGSDYDRSPGSRRPYNGASSNNGGSLYPSLDRQRRQAQGSSRPNESMNANAESPLDKSQERRLFGSSSGRRDAEVEPTVMFIRTGDTQPYCSFHYQVVLELNEPFSKRDPPMSIILQDSEPTGEGSRRPNSGGGAKSEQNSLSSDEFGHKFDDRTYTHLLTSNRKLKRIDHGTMIFRNGLKDGHRILKALHINYMSHSSPGVRQRLSSRLCAVKTDTDRPAVVGDGENRFFFKPCERFGSQSSGRENNNSGGNYGRENDNGSGGYSSSGSGGNNRDRDSYGGNSSGSGNNNRGRENNGSGSGSGSGSGTGYGRDRDSYGSQSGGNGDRRKNQQGSSSYGSSSNSGRENNTQYGSNGASQYGRDRENSNYNSNF